MNTLTIPITSDIHPLVAAHEGRVLARSLGFSLVEQTAISTAILEVATNIIRYAKEGSIELSVIEAPDQPVAIEVIARDAGPGIANIALAMQDGYTTGKGLGLGLPGAKRLMSSFEIESVVGQGTTIRMRRLRRDR